MMNSMRGLPLRKVSLAKLPASFRAAVVPLGIALLLAGPLLAQENLPPSQSSQSPATSPATQESGEQFTIRQDVSRVVVDVVVTDSNGKPVRGLTQQDFSIYEDNKPQSVLSFDAYTLDSNPSFFKKLPPLPPNTFVNIATEPERGPLYVLLLDLVNCQQQDQPYARQQLLKFVEGKPEGTRFAVFVLSDGLHLVQGFTADRAQLYKTLDPAHSIPHVPRIFLLGRNYGRNDSVAAVSVLKLIALYVDGLPGRKNIIWFSGGFPVDLFPHNDDRPDMQEEAMEALDALTRSQSAIYPVDLTGVDPNAPRLTGAVPGPGKMGESSVLGQQMASGQAFSGAGQTVQDELANMTGGRAFYGRNDLKNELEEATEAGSNHYTMTYSPSNQTFDGKLRHIKVQLGLAGKYSLEYRRGYLATAPQSAIMPEYYKPSKKHEAVETANVRPVGDSLSAYMQRGAPIAREVIFRAQVHALSSPQLATPAQMASLVDQPTYFHERQKKHPTKPLSPIKLQTYVVDYQIIARLPHLEVAAGVYDDDDRLLNGDVEEATSENPAASDPNAKFTYFRVRQKIEVPVTAVSLRLGVRDKSTDRMGTLEIKLPLAPEK
jgi:VWFA-related protein